MWRDLVSVHSEWGCEMCMFVWLLLQPNVCRDCAAHLRHNCTARWRFGSSVDGWRLGWCVSVQTVRYVGSIKRNWHDILHVMSVMQDVHKQNDVWPGTLVMQTR
jgi:hypothetical protein